jgi:KDO2-lipid IV(A) lauroyltransferase
MIPTLVHDPQTENRIHFQSYPADLETVTDYTQTHSIHVQVKGQYVTRLFIRSLLWFAQALSWKAAYRLGKGIGLLFYYSRIRRKIAMTNLDIVFKDTKTQKEKNRIYRTSLINFGRVIVNYLRIPYMGASFWKDHCTWENETLLKDVMNRRKGALLVSGHFGMMDLAGGKLGMSGYPVAVVGKRIKNPAINRFVIDTRNAMGVAGRSHPNVIRL